MSYQTEISNLIPLASLKSVFDALPIEDALGDHCFERATAAYGHSFADQGGEYAIEQVSVDRSESHGCLSFVCRIKFEYEAHLSIDDPGTGGSVYVRAAAELTLSGEFSGTSEDARLNYRVSVDVDAVHGFLVDTEWEALGDQMRVTVLADARRDFAVRAPAILSDLFPARVIRDWEYRQGSARRTSMIDLFKRPEGA